MQVAEPVCLAVIWTLARHLEHEILIQMVAANEVCICEFIVRVVLLDQVLDYGARFPENEIGVRIFDGWVAAIGINVDEGLLLDVIEFEGVYIIWDAEFFEEDDDFPGVWARGLYLLAGSKKW
jgi:hypothetical protein